MENKAIKNKAIKNNKIIKLKLNYDESELNDYIYIKNIIKSALNNELNKLLNIYDDNNFPEYGALSDALKQL